MSENPYQPPQVEQKAAAQSIGLRRIFAIASANRSLALNWRVDGFDRHAFFWLLIPLVLWLAPLVVFLWWYFPDYTDHFWLIAAIMAPWMVFGLLSNIHFGVILSPRAEEQAALQNREIRHGVLFASGAFTLKESAVKSQRMMRFLNRTFTGSSPTCMFIRVACQVIQATELQKKVFFRRPNPFDDEEVIDLEPDLEYWFVAGKIDSQKPPELVYQHLGFHSEPAVKIYYLDNHQRVMWLVLASPDADYLEQTLASMGQSFMITLGN